MPRTLQWYDFGHDYSSEKRTMPMPMQQQLKEEDEMYLYFEQAEI